ncbi:MAG: PA2169 family four-helix-bundle protein [Ferruginibacter sp.]
MKTSQTIEILNHLIEINNDRSAGYYKAVEELKSSNDDLKAIFTGMANDSKTFAQELTQMVINLGGEFATGTSSKGNLYRVWMDLATTYTENGKQAILNACKYGEDEAQNAYEAALSSDSTMDPQVKTIIAEQHATLDTALDIIRRFRDANNLVHG